MLRTINENEFSRIYEIMTESFPYDEIRSFEGQKNLLLKEEYQILAFAEGDNIMGFIALWQFPNYNFIEHFAIDKKFRNKGLGSKIIKDFIKQSDKKTILDVEPPNDDLCKRRIEFYKKEGFILHDFDYVMPAYSENQNDVRLLVMCTENMSNDDFDNFNKKIHTIINNK